MAKKTTIPRALQELCLSFPNTEHASAHGMPNFKVDGKSFAMLSINHHGDMRVGLWLKSPVGDQSVYINNNPDIYFVPPYLGSNGWLGMDLNKCPDWTEVINRVREAYENVASKNSIAEIGNAIPNRPPTQKMSALDINPLLAEKPQELLTELARRCAELPETTTAEQFGNPVWKVGKKTFTGVHYHHGRLQFQFWAGIELQAMLGADRRYTIPAYMGHNGWINLDVEDWINWDEVQGLLMQSYRHFALKRMLSALND